jgi:ABC-2 type transport system ATP-binding protein
MTTLTESPPRSGLPGTRSQASERTDPDVAIRGLVKRYHGDVGVLGIDLDIGPREVFGLVGPNGAGKTTLLSLLCGLTDCDSGSITVRGRFALCPDTPEFEPWLTASEVLRQSVALAHPRQRLDASWITEVVTATGIEEYSERRCGGFSRGMTQRLGIAAALVVDPEVLVLDEPTSALDVAGHADVLALIRRLSAERTVVLSSHALSDVQRIADTIAVMDAGRLLFNGTPRTLIDDHLQPAWRVTLASNDTAKISDLIRALSGRDWVRSVRVRGPAEIDIETTTLELGEARLVPALAELGARVRSLAPIDADLESAFLALTWPARNEGAS